MDYANVNPKLPEWAAKKAIAILHYCDVNTQDREDMTQEATLTIWRVAGQAQSEGYLYNAGKFAALLWWRRFVAQVKHYDDSRQGGFARRIVSLDATPDEALPWHEVIDAPDVAPAYGTPIIGRRRAQIRKLLRARGPWANDAAVDRAMQVLSLALTGHNTESIAMELGMAVSTVNAYRRKIRAVLEQVQTQGAAA